MSNLGVSVPLVFLLKLTYNNHENSCIEPFLATVLSPRRTLNNVFAGFFVRTLILWNLKRLKWCRGEVTGERASGDTTVQAAPDLTRRFVRVAVRKSSSRFSHRRTKNCFVWIASGNRDPSSWGNFMLIPEDGDPFHGISCSLKLS